MREKEWRFVVKEGRSQCTPTRGKAGKRRVGPSRTKEVKWVGGALPSSLRLRRSLPKSERKSVSNFHSHPSAAERETDPPPMKQRPRAAFNDSLGQILISLDGVWWGCVSASLGSGLLALAAERLAKSRLRRPQNYTGARTGSDISSFYFFPLAPCLK